MLNNQFVFQYGPLDQGWWPDGLYTAPTDELRYDLETLKRIGCNMLHSMSRWNPTGCITGATSSACWSGRTCPTATAGSALTSPT